MSWFDKRSAIIAPIVFLLPLFIYPVRGTSISNITTYTFGFPFAWFSVRFTARGGRLFLWQALAAPNQGIRIDIITAILNLIILYIIVQAILTVFIKKQKKYKAQKQSKKGQDDENDTRQDG